MHDQPSGREPGEVVIRPQTRPREYAISIPRTEAAVIKHFQARIPYGLIVPDVKTS